MCSLFSEQSEEPEKIEIVEKVNESVNFSSIDEAIEFFKSKGMSEKDWDWDAFKKYMSENRPHCAYMPNPFSWAGESEEKALKEISDRVSQGKYDSAAYYLKCWRGFHSLTPLENKDENL